MRLLSLSLNINLTVKKVDQLCINQNDLDHKYTQTSQMDRIYKESVLTIVALSGSSAICCLPGVESTTASQKAAVIIGSFIFQVRAPSFGDILASSIYESRARAKNHTLLLTTKICLASRVSLQDNVVGIMHLIAEKGEDIPNCIGICNHKIQCCGVLWVSRNWRSRTVKNL